MVHFLWIVFIVFALGIAAYHRFAGWTAVFWIAGLLTIWTVFSDANWIDWVVIAALIVPFAVTPIRRVLFSRLMLKAYRKVMPSMSRTEKEALDAGTTWWEAKLFSGMPNWRELLNLPGARLSAEEQAFIDGPVKRVCAMVSDWEVSHVRADLPPDVWQFLKDNGFFGLIIPREYGGKEFSAYAHSQILIKLNSVSPTLGSTVSVPNSLGPAELLLHYGTKEQKDYYLPRLARGDEIPCFALTSPEAGSDASSIPDIGIICKGEWNGQQVLGMRLTWNKRYITLAPVATVLGLAFKLYDPEKLIGNDEDLGITCALIPTKTPGVVIGRRHWPLSIPFQNGPTQADELFVPLDYIIGGPKMAGQGWRMLVECLSAGRAISLPASGTAATKVAAHAAGAYGRIRTQFRLPIGYMEGVEEALARIGGLTYATDAVRTLTLAAVDAGEKPSVASAIVKYHVTENGRTTFTDAMDIHGGKGVMMGPNNYLGRGYMSQPIGITVEGANILTRSLIIFGQGAIRCHPFVLAEMQAAQLEDEREALKAFDDAVWGHIGFAISNLTRMTWKGVSGGHLGSSPVNDFTADYYTQLSRLSAALAVFTDFSMAVLGGELKRREKLSARLGDLLSHLYIASATLKFFHDKGSPESDAPLVKWAVEHSLWRAQEAIYGIADNFPIGLIGRSLRRLVFPYGRAYKAPSDKLGHQVARLLLSPSLARSELIAGINLEPSQHNALAVLEQCLQDTVAAEPVWKRLRKEMGTTITRLSNREIIALAQREQRLSSDEVELLQRTENGRLQIINVDDFAPEELPRAQLLMAEKSAADKFKVVA